MTTSAQSFWLAPGSYTVRQIIAHILGILKPEPLRLDMTYYYVMLDHETIVDDEEHPLQRPDCGTVMCFAGWWGFVTTGTPLTSGYEFKHRLLDHALEHKYDDPRWWLDLNRIVQDIHGGGTAYQSPEQVSWLEEQLTHWMRTYPAVAGRMITVQ